MEDFFENYRISDEKFEQELNELEVLGFKFRETKVYDDFVDVMSHFKYDDITFNYIEFKRIFELNDSLDKYAESLSSHNFDFVETSVFTYMAMSIDDLWKRFYNDDGFDFITWYIYERGPFNDSDEVLNAYDKDGNVIDLSTPEKLYKFLNETGGYERN